MRVWLVLVLWLGLIANLVAQRLQDESLSYLYGESVMPQDRKLGLMYLSGAGDSKEIFQVIQDFWNEVNAGQVSEELLSRTGRKQVLEQLAPFLLEAPELYRQDSEQANEVLELARVRVANPVIEEGYARVRCRLEVDGGESFLSVQMFLLRELGSWRIDVLDIDWDNVVQKQSDAPMQVFGRKQRLHE